MTIRVGDAVRLTEPYLFSLPGGSLVDAANYVGRLKAIHPGTLCSVAFEADGQCHTYLVARAKLRATDETPPDC